MRVRSPTMFPIAAKQYSSLHGPGHFSTSCMYWILKSSSSRACGGSRDLTLFFLALCGEGMCWQWVPVGFLSTCRPGHIRTSAGNDFSDLTLNYHDFFKLRQYSRPDNLGHPGYRPPACFKPDNPLSSYSFAPMSDLGTRTRTPRGIVLGEYPPNTVNHGPRPP